MPSLISHSFALDEFEASFTSTCLPVHQAQICLPQEHPECAAVRIAACSTPFCMPPAHAVTSLLKQSWVAPAAQAGSQEVCGKQGSTQLFRPVCSRINCDVCRQASTESLCNPQMHACPEAHSCHTWKYFSAATRWPLWSLSTRVTQAAGEAHTKRAANCWCHAGEEPIRVSGCYQESGWSQLHTRRLHASAGHRRPPGTPTAASDVTKAWKYASMSCKLPSVSCASAG